MPVTISDEQAAEARQAIGLADDVPDDQIFAALSSAAKTAIAAGSERVEAMQTSLSRAALEREDALEEAEQLRGRVISLSRSAGEPVTATALHYATRSVEGQAADLVRSGKATPALIAKARQAFFTKGYDAKTISLSRTVEADDAQIMDGVNQFSRFMDILSSAGGASAPDAFEADILAMGRPTPGMEGQACGTPYDQGKKAGQQFQAKLLAARGLSVASS